jgi:hypothetical protein
MELANIESSNRRRNFWLAGGFATLTVIGALLFYATGIFSTHNRHEEVAARGATVMPFDLEKTVHVFEKLGNRFGLFHTLWHVVGRLKRRWGRGWGARCGATSWR